MKNTKWYPYAFLILSALFLAAAFFCPQPFFKENSLSVIGMIGGFFAFLYTQHLQSTQFLKQLFTEFNSRYDFLNEDLARIHSIKDFLTTKDENKLVDYFNLCAEEYLFYSAGYIDESIWQSWRTGMQHYLHNDLIHKLWSSELNHGSYYGLSMSVIENTKKSFKAPRFWHAPKTRPSLQR